MYELFSVTIQALLAVVAGIATGIVVVRVARRTRQRRRDALAAGPRRALLAFVADNGEQGAEDLIAVPEDAWRAALPAALGLLAKLRGEAHTALVSVFLHRGAAREALAELRSRSAVRRARAAHLLGDLELREAVPALCELLTDRDHEVRVVAVRALGRIGDPSAAWRLIASLDQRDPVPSLLATHALVQMGADAEIVLSAALDHPQARVRAVCLDALGLLGATSSITRMARVLAHDDNPDVRVAAATNLGRLGARGAVRPLIEALAPERPSSLRAAAARALGDLGAPAAVPALAARLADDEFQVAHEAAHSLRRLGAAGIAELRVRVQNADAAAHATRGAHALTAPAGGDAAAVTPGAHPADGRAAETEPSSPAAAQGAASRAAEADHSSGGAGQGDRSRAAAEADLLPGAASHGAALAAAAADSGSAAVAHGAASHVAGTDSRPADHHAGRADLAPHGHTVSGTSEAEVGHCREALALDGVLHEAVDHRAPTPAQVAARSARSAPVGVR